MLLSCGLYGNVIRLLPPLSATDEELERGLAHPRGSAWRRRLRLGLQESATGERPRCG